MSRARGGRRCLKVALGTVLVWGILAGVGVGVGAVTASASSWLAAVSAALRADGLTVGPPAANGLSLPVSGTAAQVQRAFATSIAQVRMAGGRVAYANTVAPTLGPEIAGSVQDVVGLSDVALEHAYPVAGSHAAHAIPGAARQVATAGPAPSCSGPATAGGYTPDTVASERRARARHQRSAPRLLVGRGLLRNRAEGSAGGPAPARRRTAEPGLLRRGLFDPLPGGAGELAECGRRPDAAPGLSGDGVCSAGDQMCSDAIQFRAIGAVTQPLIEW
ncbi:MAG: protease pro-enzyme activation domain-containing protein [Solirubrobacteraceae bacterium]